MSEGKLWAVHAQGSDDIYAAFSLEEAKEWAASLNALPSPISVNAVVIESSMTPAEHWQYAAEIEREHRENAQAALEEAMTVIERLKSIAAKQQAEVKA